MSHAQRITGTDDRVFTARAAGPLAREFVLTDRDGRETGRLRVRGPAGAELRGEANADIRRAPGGYRMLAGDETLLVAQLGGPKGGLEISHGGQTYDVRPSPLRNAAVARTPDGTAVELRGNLTGRRYEATSNAENAGDVVPVAVFLLHHLTSLRRRAYLAGNGRTNS